MIYFLIIVGYCLLYRIHPAYFNGADGARTLLSGIILIAYVTFKPRK
jgi:hypothetical protein